MIVKICGITRSEDAAEALLFGVDWIGLNFVGGPRKLEISQACRILSNLSDPTPAVALLRFNAGETTNRMLNELLAVGVRRIQAYGTPSAAVQAQLAAAGCSIVLVHAVQRGCAFQRALSDALVGWHAICPEFLLLDSGVPDRLGGTGVVADWNLIAQERHGMSTAALPGFLLAGGLTPENVGEAIRRLKPDGVDVSSGVESAPGVKNAERVRAFVVAARTEDLGA